MSKAYFITTITVHDKERFYAEYASQMQEVLESHGGKIIASPEFRNVTVIEGDVDYKAVVIVEFPSKEVAEAVMEDPRTKELWAIRRECSTGTIVLVEDILELANT
jgi:uncharacterized protein (DUF1330 family)